MRSDEQQTARRRMQILRALSLYTGHSAMPASLSEDMAATGYAMTLTKLMMDCAFLAELGLLSSPEMGRIALSADGMDVVRGLVKLPGIGDDPRDDPHACGFAATLPRVLPEGASTALGLPGGGGDDPNACGGAAEASSPSTEIQWKG